VKRSRKKPEKWLRIAKERILILFEQAELRPKKADRYVYLARKIAMKYNLSIPPKLKRKFCHKCYHFFHGAQDYSVRTNPKNKAVEYKCKKCGGITRYGYSKEQSGKD